MSKYDLTRRTALGGMGGLMAASMTGLPAWAQASTYNIVGHDAHKSAATSEGGGNIIEGWEKAHNSKVNWITLDVPGITDRILREASLGSTSIDLGYIVYMTQRTLKLMEPLESHIASDPIDGNMSDFPSSLLDNLKSGGTLRGLPIRITAMGLIYNEAILEERGITTMPKTMEELVEMFRECTFTRDDGTKVYGLAFYGTNNLSDGYSNFSRAYNGDYIMGDLSLVANQEGNIKSLEMMKGLFDDGIYRPESFTTTGQETLTNMANGRAAFLVSSATNVARLNKSTSSKYAGRFKVLPEWPMSEEFAGKVPYEALLQSWSIVMPKNIPDERKEISWSFMKNLVSVDSVVRQTLNGNGPARVSALADPRLADLPYRDYFSRALEHGRVHVPHIPNAIRVNDVFVQASQSALLGRQSIKEAMDEAVARAKKLV